jgi:hypothetical protein
MLTRLAVSLASVAVVVALIGPLPASARMHFTTTRERLEALSQRAASSVALTNPAEVQTQVREIITQAQAAKAAAEEAAQRPASGAEDRTVLSNVTQEMDGVVASANRALGATGADQQSALQDIKSRSDRSLSAVQTRIQAQLAAPPPAAAAQASPATLPASGQAPTSTDAPVGLWLLGFAAILVGGGLWAVARRRSAA